MCFADADDEVTPHYVEHFVDAMEEGVDVIISEAVFILCSFSLHYTSYPLLFPNERYFSHIAALTPPSF